MEDGFRFMIGLFILFWVVALLGYAFTGYMH